MTDDDVIVPPPRGVVLRRVGLLLVGSVAVVAAGELAFFPWLRGYLGSATGAEALTRFQMVMAAFGALLLVGAAWTIREGLRILRARRWPLSGAFVVRRTTVLRGKAASWRGRLLVCAGVLLAGAAIYAALLPRLIVAAIP